MYSGIIYCAVSPSNKKYYGWTFNFKSRKTQHRREAYKNNKQNYFYKGIRKYGFENFIWSIIEIYEKSDKNELKKLLCEREIFWINKDKTYLSEFGYNLTRGGEGGDTFSLRTKESQNETRQKHRKSQSGEKNHFFGKHHSQESRKKISESNKGKPSWIKGKHHTKETGLKISKSISGEKNARYVKLSLQEINEIINLYVNKKYTITEIVKKLVLSYSKIKSILIQNNIKIENDRKTPSSRKGKTYEEIYGIEKAKELKKQQSELRKGEKNHNFGKHFSEEHRRKIGKSHSNKSIWAKGKNFSEGHKKKISEGLKRYYKFKEL